jgi:hypothetical protein
VRSTTSPMPASCPLRNRYTPVANRPRLRATRSGGQAGVRPGSDQGQTRVRPGSDQGQTTSAGRRLDNSGNIDGTGGPTHDARHRPIIATHHFRSRRDPYRMPLTSGTPSARCAAPPLTPLSPFSCSRWGLAPARRSSRWSMRKFSAVAPRARVKGKAFQSSPRISVCSSLAVGRSGVGRQPGSRRSRMARARAKSARAASGAASRAPSPSK